MKKLFITAENLLTDSFSLANKVLDDGFRPDFLVGVWRGGAPVAIAMQEFLAYRGVAAEHGVIQTASYQGIADQSNTINMWLVEQLVERLESHHKLLIVDDVFDTGRSLQAVINRLQSLAGDGDHLPADIRIACPWYKPSNRKIELQPDYYLHTTEQWLVFPHELLGLSEQEIVAGRPELAEFFSG